MEVEPAEASGARHRAGDGGEAHGARGGPKSVGGRRQTTHGHPVSYFTSPWRGIPFFLLKDWNAVLLVPTHAVLVVERVMSDTQRDGREKGEPDARLGKC